MPKSRRILSFLLKIINNKFELFFWFGLRLFSALLPLLSIFLYSTAVKQLETGSPLSDIAPILIIEFVNRIFDNYIRLRSVTRLEHLISNITFEIHSFFLSDLKTENKNDRFFIVQAIRNFADATGVTLNLIKQPGIDSIVSLIFIPSILFILDFRVFVMSFAYIVIYNLVDYYMTQHYRSIKDALNTKTENYYSKLQESNDFELEQVTYTRHFGRLANWGFHEWFTLQNTAVIFYSLILGHLVIQVSTGSYHLSDLVLLMGYVTQIQPHLNSFSSIKDSLADMTIGLQHLAKDSHIAAVDLDDLI